MSVATGALGERGAAAMTWGELHRVLVDRGVISTQPRSDSTIARARETATGVSYDSRAVQPGHVFVALHGQHADGTAFARQAVERGAIAVVAERGPADAAAGDRVDWIVVSDARLALAALAAAFYGHPSREMQVIGITGTNGKTTTAFLVASIFEAARTRCGVIGTVAYRLGPGEQDIREAARTTPEAPDVQALLREMVVRGCGACAMEVSSHALALKRVDEMTFRAGVFTNLTRDHLDFHGDMETYFQAKRRLFEMLPPDAPALINLDDPKGAALVAAGGRPVTYAIGQAADITPSAIEYSLDGLAFDIRTPRGTIKAESKLVGRPNVYNILAAVGTAIALDVPFDAIERGLRSLAGVPGRFQLASGTADEVTVVVDYAHTDDALRNLLETARALTRGRMITVFGCGGDRDRTKRPLMGAVAARLSDVIVITSDNPRSEDPNRIIDDVLRGLTPDTTRDGAPRVLTIADRRDAIHQAIATARRGDLVLIAGKGHEKYQVIGTRTIPFDDVAVAQDALSRRRTNSGVV